MTPTQAAADAAWMVALVVCLAIAFACAVAIAAICAWQARHLYQLVTDRLETARMRGALRRIAARAPFDDAQQRAADTANCAIDDQDTKPGSDHQTLADLNRIYNAPSWEDKP